MNMFKMMQKARQMQSQMKEADKKLQSKRVEVNLGGINIVANGKHEVVSISLDDEVLNYDKVRLEAVLLKALKEAFKDVTKLLEKEAKDLTGGMDMDSMMNMLK